MQNRSTGIELVGTWMLTSWERHSDGRVLDQPLGPQPIGLITYDANGFVQVQMMRPGRQLNNYQNPRNAANAELRGRVVSDSAAQEVAEAYASFAAYAGRYEIDAGQQMIHHHIITSLDPNMTGTVVVRSFEIRNQNVLELRTKPYLVKDVEMRGVLKWRRAVVDLR